MLFILGVLLRSLQSFKKLLPVLDHICKLSETLGIVAEAQSNAPGRSHTLCLIGNQEKKGEIRCKSVVKLREKMSCLSWSNDSMALETLLKREKIPEASIEVAITLDILIERLLTSSRQQSHGG